MARYSTICPETDKICDRRCGLGVVCPKRHDRLVALVKQQKAQIESLQAYIKYRVPFDRAFAAARKAGASEFWWRGGHYNTKLEGE